MKHDEIRGVMALDNKIYVYRAQWEKQGHSQKSKVSQIIYFMHFHKAKDISFRERFTILLYHKRLRRNSISNDGNFGLVYAL